jgi:hypothetical protein
MGVLLPAGATGMCTRRPPLCVCTCSHCTAPSQKISGKPQSMATPPAPCGCFFPALLTARLQTMIDSVSWCYSARATSEITGLRIRGSNCAVIHRFVDAAAGSRTGMHDGRGTCPVLNNVTKHFPGVCTFRQTLAWGAVSCCSNCLPANHSFCNTHHARLGLLDKSDI